ncbi:hypothetical protein J7J45_02815, partial [Candidatus Aerophobetes bacterium]|nr:hypothetical protein [Candidatus Aerophobetes bacterium]
MREESERERIREALRARKFSGIAKSIEILKYRLFRAYSASEHPHFRTRKFYKPKLQKTPNDFFRLT